MKRLSGLFSKKEQERTEMAEFATSDEFGPLETDGYVIPEKGADFELRKITLPPLKATQVQVDMSHCGLCHTELHMQNNDWGTSDYPLCPGHEGVGIVAKVGPAVKNLQVGDRVGIAWIRDSCGACDKCSEGRENLCAKGYQGTYLGPASGMWGKEPYHEHGGCFAKVMRVEEKFATKIPDILPSTFACPLLCGGATVFEPLINHIKPGCTVGVYSIGGLGTCAIKLAKLLGATVTAFSRSSAKEAGARAAGATNYVVTTDEKQMEAAACSVDLMINTCPVNQDLGPLMNLLKFDGICIRVGLPGADDQAFGYNWIPMIFTQRAVGGSIVTGSRRMNLLFKLVAENYEASATLKDAEGWAAEVVPFDKINEVSKNLAEGKNKGYRYVLEW